MSFLLDTHTYLWLIFEPNKMSQKVKESIKNADNNIFVSVVTFWEISLKHAMGRLELKNCTSEELVEVTKKVNIDILSLKSQDAASFYHLPKMGHKDPFDRMIIWQAIQNQLTLISKDREFDAYKSFGLKTLW